MKELTPNDVKVLISVFYNETIKPEQDKTIELAVIKGIEKAYATIREEVDTMCEKNIKGAILQHSFDCPNKVKRGIINYSSFTGMVALIIERVYQHLQGKH